MPRQDTSGGGAHATAVHRVSSGARCAKGAGRHRWVAERTLAWLNQFRRLPIRYERRDDLHQAFLNPGCALICFRVLQRRE